MTTLTKPRLQLLAIARGWALRTLPGWTDDSHRDLLARHGASAKDGRISATTMTSRQLDTALADYKARGWSSKPARNVDGKYASGLARRAGNYESKIRALWLDLHAKDIVREPDEIAMQAFVKRTTGVDLAHWCSDAQCVRVIESLKKWSERVDQERTRLALALAGAPS